MNIFATKCPGCDERPVLANWIPGDDRHPDVVVTAPTNYDSGDCEMCCEQQTWLLDDVYAPDAWWDERALHSLLTIEPDFEG